MLCNKNDTSKKSHTEKPRKKCFFVNPSHTTLNTQRQFISAAASNAAYESTDSAPPSPYSSASPHYESPWTGYAGDDYANGCASANVAGIRSQSSAMLLPGLRVRGRGLGLRLRSLLLRRCRSRGLRSRRGGRGFCGVWGRGC